MNRMHFRPLRTVLMFAVVCAMVPAMAQLKPANSGVAVPMAPPLGLVSQFTVLAASGVTGSAGVGTTVLGDVGSSPTATITNFPPSMAAPPFDEHFTNDGTVQQARIDAIAAYEFLAAQGPGTVIPDQLDTQMLTSGIYSFASGAADLAMNGTLTLDGPGIFVFQVDSALTANVGSNIVGTADPCNIYWRVGTSATLNGLTFRGQVFADESITIGAGSNVTGRTIAGTGAAPADPDGAVTMAGAGGNTIGGCALPGVVMCPTITVNPATLPNSNVGATYNATITASGGSGSYTFAVTGGALPPGLTLNMTTGAITGTTTTPGMFSPMITATDTSNPTCSGNRTYTIMVFAAVTTSGGPTLDFVGLTVLMLLLIGAGLFAMNRFSL